MKEATAVTLLMLAESMRSIMHRMTSSWREASLDQTRREAESVAGSLGVTRVVDVTRLDRIGIPVYVSVRPDAMEGSLCVNAGKGSTPDEARVGALMEAIEFAAAENNRGGIEVFQSSPAAIASQPSASGPFVDYCAVWGEVVQPNGAIDAVNGTDLRTGLRVALPAELVFSPYPANAGQRLFGTSTNGLCSGNTLREAALHGICEVIERDILSFNCVCDSSTFVAEDELPDVVESLVRQIQDAGMQVSLRYTANCFGMPFCQAYIQADVWDPIQVSVGSGFHASATVAAVRAITEAAQSRLSYIHGGRDDLAERARYFAGCNANAERIATAALQRQAFMRATVMHFAELPTRECSTIDEALTLLTDSLAENGMSQISYVDLSPPDCQLFVLKVIVPGLESFNARVPRIGRRLLAHIQQCA